MLSYRATSLTDAHYLLDIDIKCFTLPWTPSEWIRIGRSCSGAVATWHGMPVGMIIFRRNYDGDIEILKVGVKPAFRRKGIGSRLVFNCIVAARETFSPCVRMVIPESCIDPGQPHDLSEWLKKREFRACLPLLPGHFFSFGEPENGVSFVLAVPLT